MKKRIHGLVGFLLAVVMAIGMFPSTALAVESNADGSGDGILIINR